MSGDDNEWPVVRVPDDPRALHRDRMAYLRELSGSGRRHGGSAAVGYDREILLAAILMGWMGIVAVVALLVVGQ